MEIYAVIASAQSAPLIPIEWMIVGFFGQFLFTSRFIVQWIASERAGKSVVPSAFWFLSIAGAAFLLTYAIYRQDPVFILGQSAGFFVYSRNLMLIAKSRKDNVEDELMSQEMPEVPA